MNSSLASPAVSKTRPISKYLKPSNPVVVFATSPRPKPQSLCRKSTKLNEEATAVLETGNGAVGVDPSKKGDENTAPTEYGRHFFPLAAVVGQVGRWSCL